MKKQVKKKTSLDKIVRPVKNGRNGRLKSTEPSTRGRVRDTGDADRCNGPKGQKCPLPLVPSPSDGQQRRGVKTACKAYPNPQVAVVDKNNTPLMPSKASRARRWIKSGKATPFWKNGIFCIRLNFDPSGTKKQSICVGIDPGSKFEGFTVKAKHATFLNVQTGAVTWVKDRVETRRNMRKSRRGRNTPCRKPRFYRNRGKTFMPPSTKARWQWKLRIVDKLRKVFPVTSVCVEDIQAKTKAGKKAWNQSFSPLQIGKTWFYEEVKKRAQLFTKAGHETKALRDTLGLKKVKDKAAKTFDAHCVDSWVLAHSIVGGDSAPDNTSVLYIKPLQLHRRQLHALQPTNNVRRPYGGTRSLSFKRGSLVKHPKYGFAYVGGTSKNRVSLHDTKTGVRLSQEIRPAALKFISFNFNPNYLCNSYPG